MKGKKHSEETKRRISEKKKLQHIVPKSAFKKGLTPWNKGKKCPYTTERNLTNNPGGKLEKHWNWQGGITTIYLTIRQMPEYIQWRSAVFTRDNYTCQMCKEVQGHVVVHHIIPFAKILKSNEILTREQALVCKILWDINNGITLCPECHHKTEGYGIHIK
jgi:hypothetical protein